MMMEERIEDTSSDIRHFVLGIMVLIKEKKDCRSRQFNL
jgi:hypothetical protein